MSPSFSKASPTSSHASLRAAKEPFKHRKPPPASPDRRPPPVIVHVEPARIIHARPQEFRRLVQLLTGKQSPAAAVDCSPELPESTAVAILPCSHLLIDINVAYEEGDDDEDDESSRFSE